MADQQEPGWKRNGRNGPFDWWLACGEHEYDYRDNCMTCHIVSEHNAKFAEKVDAALSAVPPTVKE